MTKHFKKIIVLLREIVSGFMPYRCPGCGGPWKDLVCPDCEKKIKRISAPFCETCGRPLPPGVRHTENCRACISGDLNFDLCRSILFYEDPVCGIVKKFKYGRNIYSGRYLAAAIADRISGEPEYFPGYEVADAIVPVPLHPFRLLWRGFNQSALLAKVVSAAFGIRTASLLYRRRNTRPQSLLSASQRKKNVHGAFSVIKSADVAGRRLILIDDVMTSGATVDECSRALKDAGADKVYVLTAARRV